MDRAQDALAAVFAARDRASRALFGVRRDVTRFLSHLERRSRPCFARIAGAGRSQPLGQVAMAMPEMEARLQGCPVYTVVNRNKEFLLVSDEQSKEKQLGFFFFSQDDAQHLLGQVKEKDPGLAKSASIMQVSLDKVYRFAMVPREKELQGVMFRFFPDQREVKNALDLFQERGLSATSMVGVPVFQAEGLTIKAEDKRYVPLFFSKNDLDKALESSMKDAGQEVKVAAKKQLVKEEKELKRMERLYKKKSISEEDLKEQQERTERIRSYARDPSKPKVDVGSFEQVLTEMQRDDDEYSLWRQVIFVPAGASYFRNPTEEEAT